MAELKIYTIANTRGETEVVIQPRRFNGPGGVQSTDLHLYGNGAKNWGENYNQNFYRLLENFAVGSRKEIDSSNRADEPQNSTDIDTTDAGINEPVKGQLWYNTTNGYLFSYDGDSWGLVNVLAQSSEPDHPVKGALWFDTSSGTNEINVWNGDDWDTVITDSSLQNDLEYVTRWNEQETITKQWTFEETITFDFSEASTEKGIDIDAGDDQNATLSIDWPNVGSSADGVFALGRNTDTDGEISFEVYRGDGQDTTAAVITGKDGAKFGDVSLQGEGSVNAESVYQNGVRVIDFDDLTSDEVDQLSNIDDNTITNTQWGYISDLDQSLTTSSNVQFNSIEQDGNSVLDKSTPGYIVYYAATSREYNGEEAIFDTTADSFNVNDRVSANDNMTRFTLEPGLYWISFHGRAEIFESNPNISLRLKDITDDSILDYTHVESEPSKDANMEWDSIGTSIPLHLDETKTFALWANTNGNNSSQNADFANLMLSFYIVY